MVHWGLMSLLGGLLFSGLLGCSSTQAPATMEPKVKQQSHTETLARDFFQVYAKRSNIEALMAFYADNAVIEDIVYGEKVEGKNAIRQFYDWGSEHVSLLTPESIELLNLLVQDRVAVGRGVFHPFRYYDQQLGPWRFIIWLEFDENGKIIKQVDWINYRPKEMFIGGDDLNVVE